MNNYSYITLLSDDSYIYGIILLQESLKKVNAQFPLKVLVTSNVSQPILEIMRQLDLEYKIIDPIYSQELVDYNKTIQPRFARTWALCLSKFETFNLVEYDKIIFLDADILVLKNLDHLFEYPHLTSALDGEYFNLWPDNPHFNSGILVIKPDKKEYTNLTNFYSNLVLDEDKKIQCIADQEILNMYYSDWPFKEELHLNKYYDIFAPYIGEEQINDVDENCYFIHFVGRKPWRSFFKIDTETYTEKYYDIARQIITEKVNQLDWDAAKDKIKVAVYGICKNEIVNIEKYINCFIQADYLCILDTGSTDGTWEYLQESKKKYPNLIIDQKIINPWRYDTARNLSLELVPKDTVMYFMVDLDEIIKEPDWSFRIKACWNPLFSRGTYVYNRQVNPENDSILQQFKEHRIHNHNWHYGGLVHEQLYDIVGDRGFVSDECLEIPIVVWHYPTKPNRDSYVELCERGVQEEPDNWLMHLQLAAEYEVHELYDKAIAEYRSILINDNQLSPPEVGRCYASLGRALNLIGKQEEALQVLSLGQIFCPECGDTYFLAAEIYIQMGEFQKTIDLCKKGLENNDGHHWCTIVNTGGFYPYYLLGLSEFYLDHPILAIGYMAIARERNNNQQINEVFNLIMNKINGG